MIKVLISWLFVLYKILGEIKHLVLYSVFGFSYKCKHYPTCSAYTLNLIKKEGLVVGMLKGIKRICLCH